jgi:uncharacterized protein (TIGR02145 family)
MKTFTLTLFILLSVLILHAQDYTISFSGNGATTSLETVKIENLTQGKSITLSGSEILHLKAIVTGNNPILEYVDYPLHIYPNPSDGNCTVEFGARKSGSATIKVFDLIGREIARFQQTVANGIHSFSVTGISNGIYSINMNVDDHAYTAKLVSNSKSSSRLTINYIGNRELLEQVTKLKSATAERFWQYNTGDRLKFVGTSGKFSTVVMDIPTSSKTLSFKFVECTDADGNNYPIVQIGTQIWMAENLKTGKYNDGSIIPSVTGNSQWASLNSGAYSWYNNDFASYKNLYGALYNWYAVNTGKLCPTGWQAPSDVNWKTLITFLGGEYVAGNSLKEAGTTHWASPNTGATNSSGFSGLPGGYRFNGNGSFDWLFSTGLWWTSTEYSTTFSVSQALDYNYNGIYNSTYEVKGNGYSVRCVIGNVVGSLPTVTTTAASSVTTTGATLGGNVISDGGAVVTERGVCISTIQNPTTLNKYSIGTGLGIFSSNYTGMVANTTYYVRAYAINSQGTAYGSQIAFTAGSTLSLPTVTTTAASNVTTIGATLGGNVTGDGGAAITSRGICWSTSQNPTTANSKTTDGIGIGSFTSSITGLTAGITYYVRAYAANGLGTAYGNQITFTTSLNPSLATVTTSSVTNITMTGATLGGNVTSDGGAGILERGICLTLAIDQTYLDLNKFSIGNGLGTFSKDFTGLKQNTEYCMKAYAINSKGTSYGIVTKFITSLLPTVTTTTASNITSTGANLGGNVTSDGNATVTERGVVYATIQNPTTANTKVAIGTGTGSFNNNVSLLIPGTTYYFRAYAMNNQGTAYGSQQTFTTSNSLSIPTVATLLATNFTQTSATAGGDITSDGGANVTSRGVCWSISSNPTITNSKTTDGTGTGKFDSSLTGLTAGTTYYLRAYATNSAGTAYGNEVSFTTVTGLINDNCGGAILISQYGSAEYGIETSGDTNKATQSIPAGSCGGNADDDVWYKFVAMTSNPVIRVQGYSSGFGYDAVVELRSGGCNGNVIQCSNSTGTNNPELIYAQNLIIGATYFIRVYGFYGNDHIHGIFKIVVLSSGAVNNVDPSNATPLAYEKYYLPIPGTPPNFNISSLWYKFVAISSNPIIRVKGYSDTNYGDYDAVIELYGGNGTLTFLSSVNKVTGTETEYLYASNLIIGSIYYIKVDNYKGLWGSFEIGVYGNAIDDCDHACQISQNSSCNPTIGSTYLATQSIPAGSCGGNPDDDVWFKFVPMTSNPTIKVQGDAGFDVVVELWSPVQFTGVCNGKLVGCSDNSSAGGVEYIYAKNLNIVETHYIRVYSKSGGNTGAFTICVYNTQ